MPPATTKRPDTRHRPPTPPRPSDASMRGVPCDCEGCVRSRPYLGPRSTTPHDFARGIRPAVVVAEGYEAAYRRGVAQATALTCDLVLECTSLDEAKTVLRAAEKVTQDLREDPSRGGGALLDLVGSEVRSGKGRGSRPEPSPATDHDPI